MLYSVGWDIVLNIFEEVEACWSHALFCRKILCSRYLERLRPAEGLIFVGRKNVSKFERRCDLLKPYFVVSDGRSCRSD
jgi:hypothetical protein